MTVASAQNENFDYSIFDHLIDSVLVVDARGRIVYANEAASAVCGISLRRLINKKFLNQVLQIEGGPFSLSSGFSSVVEPTPWVEVTVTPVSGDEGIFQISVQPDANSAAPDPCWIVFLHDVTLEQALHKKYRNEIKEKQSVIQDLKRAQKQLTEYFKSLEAIAFVLLFSIHGFSFLALKYTVETIPPFLSVGLRFLIGGALLLAYLIFVRGILPAREEIKTAGISAIFYRVISFGCVAWALKTVPSGVAAVVVAGAPIWLLFLEWALRGKRPHIAVASGLAVGVISVAYLTFSSMDQTGALFSWGPVALLVASVAWAFGAFLSAKSTTRPILMVAMDLFIGGLILTLVSGVTEDWASLSMDTISERSLISFLYTTIFVTMIASPAMAWLMNVDSSVRGASFFYAKPVIALIVGWLIGNEVLELSAVVACIGLILAVVLVTKKRT